MKHLIRLSVGAFSNVSVEICSTPAVILDFGYCSLVRRTTRFNSKVQWGSIPTQIPTGQITIEIQNKYGGEKQDFHC